MKTKVLIPGLGVAKSLGWDCPCNLSYDELLVNPSTFLWLDKLCTPVDLSKSFFHAYDKNPYLDYTVRVIFDTLGEEGVVETITNKDLLSLGQKLKSISEFVDGEIQNLLIASPDEVRMGTDNLLEIKGESFCNPFITAGYASQLLANRIGATCLIDRPFNRYLHYKQDILSNAISLEQRQPNKVSIYNEIFSVVVANDISFPKLLFSGPNKCLSCGKFTSCEQSFKEDVKKTMRQLIECRNSDSFHLLRKEMDAIVKKFGGVQEVSAQDVADELHKKALRIFKKQKKEFPRIKRWTNLAMIMALPSSFVAKGLGWDAVASTTVAVFASSKIVDAYIQYESNKDSWINFLNKRTSQFGLC